MPATISNTARAARRGSDAVPRGSPELKPLFLNRHFTWIALSWAILLSWGWGSFDISVVGGSRWPWDKSHFLAGVGTVGAGSNTDLAEMEAQRIQRPVFKMCILFLWWLILLNCRPGLMASIRCRPWPRALVPGSANATPGDWTKSPRILQPLLICSLALAQLH